MTKGFRVRYIGESMEPKPGSLGTAYRCEEYSNPYSVEHGAYMFFPDETADAGVAGYYVGDDDLEDIK